MRHEHFTFDDFHFIAKEVSSERVVKGFSVSRELPIFVVVKCDLTNFCVVKCDLHAYS